jgi:hypothetical protein
VRWDHVRQSTPRACAPGRLGPGALLSP